MANRTMAMACLALIGLALLHTSVAFPANQKATTTSVASSCSSHPIPSENAQGLPPHGLPPWLQPHGEHNDKNHPHEEHNGNHFNHPAYPASICTSAGKIKKCGAGMPGFGLATSGANRVPTMAAPTSSAYPEPYTDDNTAVMRRKLPSLPPLNKDSYHDGFFAEGGYTCRHTIGVPKASSTQLGKVIDHFCNTKFPCKRKATVGCSGPAVLSGKGPLAKASQYTPDGQFVILGAQCIAEKGTNCAVTPEGCSLVFRNLMDMCDPDGMTSGGIIEASPLTSNISFSLRVNPYAVAAPILPPYDPSATEAPTAVSYTVTTLSPGQSFTTHKNRHHGRSDSSQQVSPVTLFKDPTSTTLARSKVERQQLACTTNGIVMDCGTPNESVAPTFSPLPTNAIVGNLRCHGGLSVSKSKLQEKIFDICSGPDWKNRLFTFNPPFGYPQFDGHLARDYPLGEYSLHLEFDLLMSMVMMMPDTCMEGFWYGIGSMCEAEGDPNSSGGGVLTSPRGGKFTLLIHPKIYPAMSLSYFHKGERELPTNVAKYNDLHTSAE